MHAAESIQSLRNLTPIPDVPASRGGVGFAAAPSPADVPSLDEAIRTRDAKALVGEFQTMLFSEMVKAMRETVPENELFGRSTGEDVFESFLDQEYARALSHAAGGRGLLEALERQLGVTDEESVGTQSQLNQASASAEAPLPGRLPQG